MKENSEKTFIKTKGFEFLFDRKLSNDEIRSIVRDPYQMFSEHTFDKWYVKLLRKLKRLIWH